MILQSTAGHWQTPTQVGAAGDVFIFVHGTKPRLALVYFGVKSGAGEEPWGESSTDGATGTDGGSGGSTDGAGGTGESGSGDACQCRADGAGSSAWALLALLCRRRRARS